MSRYALTEIILKAAPGIWSSEAHSAAEAILEAGWVAPTPPIVTFGPGDLVKYKYGENVFALGTAHFTIVKAPKDASRFADPVGTEYTYGVNGKRKVDEFTSETFEKVEVAA